MTDIPADDAAKQAEPTDSPGDDRIAPEDIVLREDDDPSEDGSPDVGRAS